MVADGQALVTVSGVVACNGIAVVVAPNLDAAAQEVDDAECGILSCADAGTLVFAAGMDFASIDGDSAAVNISGT